MDFEHQHPTLSSWLNTVLHEEIEAGIITIRQKKEYDNQALVINHLQQWAIELECTVSFEWNEELKSEKEKIH